jgi:hypothetical protein
MHRAKMRTFLQAVNRPAEKIRRFL